MVLMLQRTSGPSFAQSVVRDVKEKNYRATLRAKSTRKQGLYGQVIFLYKFQSNYTYIL